MSKKDRKGKNYFDIGPLLQKDHESLLLELKERAVNVAIDERAEFEKSLLQLAQEIKDENKRSAVYEVLVSLQILWNRYKPEKGLHEKFRTAFDGGNYQEAEAIYKRLAKQGLDYIETYRVGEGNLIPLVTGKRGMLLQYNKKEVTLYNLEFEQLSKVLVPEHMTIIDVVVPDADQFPGSMEIDKTESSIWKIWILLQDKKHKKAIVSIDFKDIDTIKEIKCGPEQAVMHLGQNLESVTRLTFFRNHLLLISNKTIYYQKDDKKWQEWYSTRDEITASETTNEGFWIGHINGDVIMLKNLYHVGNRVALPGFAEPITNIRKKGRHVLVWSKIRLLISDYGGNPVSKPIETQCEIRQAEIPEENLLLMLLANGMLTARDIDQGNIRWQINSGDLCEILFSFQRYFCCGKRTGEVLLFEIPAFHTMTKDLESQNIYVEKQSLDLDPNTPVRYISEFTGREKILDEIKSSGKAHFLLYGEPRIGKTSLLNVLPDVLSEKAKCCIIEISELMQNSKSYETFEKKFIKTCMEQHFIKLPLPEKEGCNYQALRAMVKKIKRNKNFCIFCLDNFFVPTHFDRRSQEDFITFLSSLFVHPDVRLIITCSQTYKKNIEKYFGDLKDVLKQRNLLHREIPLFSEGEVKNTIRGKISLHQSEVDKVYQYTGRFPHLLHFYDRWQPDNQSIEEYSKEIVSSFSDEIFEYFRDLSLDARLLIATCLHEDLILKKISYATLYEKFPFIKSSLPDDQLKESIKKIDGYGSGLSVEEEGEIYKINLSGNAQLFYEAAKHIPWIKDFKTVYEFASAPNQQKAQSVAQMFTRITGSTLEINEFLDKRTRKFIGKFYVNKLTEKGLKTLRMPLTTFVVVSLTTWQRESHKESFRDLIIEFHEFNRQSRESQMFYVLLFYLHDISKEIIRENLKGFDRISIIDAVMMKNIILAHSPQDRASKYIFEQLSIRERSPYTTSGAVSDSLFFGREMEIALIRGLPENIGVFGVRTIGKTSLLRKLQKAFNIQKGWEVYDMDCSRIESEESLLNNLAEKMGIHFREISDIDKFRQYVTKKVQESGCRYLFLLDEVDRLVEYDMHHDERIFKTFNRLCNESTKGGEAAARFILFGFHQMWQQMKNPESRLYNFMVFLPLQALDKDGAMGLVTRPIEKIQVHWKNKEDAEYLVNSCSRHPRLLQTACHSLLNILDSKLENRNIIERKDVDQALNSDRFREICMRLYHTEEKHQENSEKAILFKRVWGKNRKAKRNTGNAKDEFLGDIHRITILTAIHLLSEEGKEIFTITDIQKKLKDKGIDISPDVMRNVLDRLCLSGNFRLREEPTIIAKEGTNVLQKAKKMNTDGAVNISSHLDVTVNAPVVYVVGDTTIHKFTYEFGIKIFPKLLAADFGGYEKCEEERQRLIKKGEWREYLKRF